MPRTVSASEANQNFSKLLGEAEDGETIIIQRRGVTVAHLTPTAQKARERRIKAVKEFIALMETFEPVVIGPWTREELYEDEIST